MRTTAQGVPLLMMAGVLAACSSLVPRAVLWGPISTDDILPLAAVVLSAPAWCGFVFDVLKRRAVRTLLVVFVIASGASLLAHASSPIEAAVGVARLWLRMGVYVALGGLGVALGRGVHAERWASVMTAVILMQALYGSLAFVLQFEGPLHTGIVHYPSDAGVVWARAQGFFGGLPIASEPMLNRANFYSAFLVLGLPLVLGRQMNGRLKWATSGSIAVAILASLSRMSALMMLLVLGATFGLRRALRRSLVAGASLAVVVLAWAPLRARFLDVQTDRLEQWYVGLSVAWGHPWFGVGHNNYLHAARPVADAIGLEALSTPHSSVIFAAASYGVVVGLCVGATYLLLLNCWLKRWRSPWGFAGLSVVVVFVLHDQTNNLFFVPEVAGTAWLILGWMDGRMKDTRA